MKNLVQVRETIAKLTAEAEAIVNVAREEKREPSADETARIDAILGVGDKPGELDAARKDEARALKIENNTREILARSQPANSKPTIGSDGEQKTRVEIAASVYRPAHIGLGAGLMNRAEQCEHAYRFGQFILASRFQNGPAAKWCEDHGIRIVNAATEGWDSRLGVFVPEEFSASMIELVLQYGVARRECEDVTMTSDTQTTPRWGSDLTTYYVGESVAPTVSDPSADNVRLTAKTLGALGRYSGLLNEDSVIAIGDAYSRSGARAFAKAEDEALFLGDGTSTYGRIVGLKNALNTGSHYEAIAGNTAFSTLDMADFLAMKGQCADWAIASGNAKWYINRSAYASSMERLALASGGATVTETVNGVPQVRFLGYPVVFVNIMNSTLTAQTSTTGLAYFGDLRMGVKFGNRRRFVVKTSDQVYFTTDELCVLFMERYDINVHDIGVTSGASGGIVMLKTPGA
jgi:HK97 family phage major capsid protein